MLQKWMIDLSVLSDGQFVIIPLYHAANSLIVLVQITVNGSTQFMVCLALNHEAKISVL